MTQGSRAPDTEPASTRGGFLRAIAAGGAVVTGGAALGAARDGTSIAAQERDDTSVLNLLLTLEYVQEAFYREALRTRRLDGPLLDFARSTAEQENRHAAFLKSRLGRRARRRPRTEAGDLVRTPEAFRKAAVDLEEAVIAAYVGQGANLSQRNVGRVGTIVSVEARQAAWIRDLAGILPAPRGADTARKGEDVLDELRAKGLLA